MPADLIVIFVILGFLFLVIIFSIYMLVKTTQARKAAKRSKKDLKNRVQADKVITLTHVAGLPLSEGSVCNLALTPDSIVIEKGPNSYNLSFSKVTDMCVKTDTDIRKAYVSSVGGAVGGAVLFGPLGAMIGGRTKEKVDTVTHSFFIITYSKDGGTDYISFECTGNPSVFAFINAFEGTKRVQKTVNL